MTETAKPRERPMPDQKRILINGLLRFTAEKVSRVARFDPA